MIKILLVDDGSVDIMLTTIALQGCSVPHTLAVASDGAEAYEFLMEREVDLLLLDIKMPRVSGFDLLEKLKSANNKLIPVIMLSGSGLQSDRMRARELGAVEFVQKAVDFAAFKIELKQALNKHGFC
jgi:CheY-like chemotaxis protein